MAKKQNTTEQPMQSQYKVALKCKNTKQKDLVKSIKNNEITFCTGSAGTGKSYVTLATALDLLQKDNKFKKIILLCNTIESDISIGHLKGSIYDKVFPFVFPHLYTLSKILTKDGQDGEEIVKQLQKDKKLEIMCVSFLRGLTIDNSIVIIEEAQNLPKSSFKTILTRIGDNSKYIFDGDLEQIDNKELKKSNVVCGLKHAVERLKDVDGVGVVEFNKDEIVRNPIITKILDVWEETT